MNEDPSRPVQTLDRDSESIHIALRIPEGYRFLPDRHHHLHILSTDETVLEVSSVSTDDLAFDWDVPVEIHGEGETTLIMTGMVFFCPASDALVCIYAQINLEQTVIVKAGSGCKVEIVHHIDLMDELPGGRTIKVRSEEGRKAHCGATQ